MKSRLKVTGLFFGLIFIAAALINVIDNIVNNKLPLIAAFTDVNYVISLAAISAFFLASAYISWLAWLQPVFFLCLTAFSILSASDSFFGLGLFVVGVLLLFKLDFYQKNRVTKAVISFLFILIIEVAAALNKGERFYQGLMPAFFIIAFLLFLFLTFRDKFIVYLKEPKVKLSLDAKGLAESEQLYIRRMIGGKSVKEVSFEFGVSESTVRNTLSRAYKKLGVNSKAGVADLSQKYQIVQ